VAIDSDEAPPQNDGRARLALPRPRWTRCASGAQRAGKLLVTFAIQGGRVRDPQVIMDSVRDEKVSGCVARAPLRRGGGRERTGNGSDRRPVRRSGPRLSAQRPRSFPNPSSTTSGTARSAALLICAFTIGATASTFGGRRSSTSSSWTWRSMRAWYFPRSAASTSSMARFIRSAALPWMGVLTAVRSAALRALGFLLLMSGR